LEGGENKKGKEGGRQVTNQEEEGVTDVGISKVM